MNHDQLAMKSAFAALLLTSTTSVWAQDFFIDLEGFQQVPAVSTSADGSFFLQNSPPFFFELVYELEGEITQAHIHLGQSGVNGGVMIWLCVNPFAGIAAPVGTPECIGNSGSVAGELEADDVVGPAGQGVEPGAGQEALRAIRHGVAYVNVHSDFFPGGEIRGQLRPVDEAGDDIDTLRDDIDQLREDFDHHTHEYLTGRGNGHNNTEADSGPPEY